MKNIINWKLFFILLAACVVASFLVLPYEFAIIPAMSELFSPALLVAAFVQAIVFFSIAIFFGLILSKRVGFNLPVLEGWLKGEKQGGYLKSILGLSVGLGILGGLLIILLSVPFGNLSVEFLRAEAAAAAWKGFLASFYGGIAEEILCRLFLVSLFAWIFMKFKKTREGRPTNIGIWLSIILAAILFGLGHLPITADITAITPVVILRAIFLNGVPGIIFGWLFWKKGLESAIIAHFSADIVIHVITPLVALLFI
ncbi:MAG: CPBP family intramembrane metalloprotease [Patescibacteria group bacterium]|nr:CPBP family intramembrane metalloprotease [Patescibacteria group bacterium]